MPQMGYSIGRDVTIVITLADGTQLRPGKVTSFSWKPETTKSKIKALDGTIDTLRFWEGGSGTIKAERRNGDSGGEVNKVYLSEVFHLKFVRAIDGVKVSTPASEGELRALYARLDDEGNEAVQNGVLEHFLEKENGDDLRGELGNS